MNPATRNTAHNLNAYYAELRAARQVPKHANTNTQTPCNTRVHQPLPTLSSVNAAARVSCAELQQ
jgi:hypothetical protein